MNIGIISGWVTLACLACSTAPSEKVTVASERQDLASEAGTALGYYHQPSASKFAVGLNPQVVVEPKLIKTIGTLGVFAIDRADGSARAVANASAPHLAALTNDPNIHNARVLSYFVGAGLPSEQVEAVHPLAAMKGTAAKGDAIELLMVNRTFDSYTSVISRVVAGIPVPDSFAWARFQSDGSVEAEGVHWPTVAGAVIADAQSLQTALGDPVSGPKLVAKLAPGAFSVVIRHSMAGYHGTPQMFAAVDVQDVRGLRPVTRHYGIDGSELTLDSSVVAPAQPSWQKQ